MLLCQVIKQEGGGSMGCIEDTTRSGAKSERYDLTKIQLYRKSSSRHYRAGGNGSILKLSISRFSVSVISKVPFVEISKSNFSNSRGQ